jgi:hypothetical protein
MDNTTKRQLRSRMLVDRAMAAGLSVTNEGSRIVIVRSGKGACSAIVYDNGTIIRGDVRLDLAKPISVARAASLLGVG